MSGAFYNLGNQASGVGADPISFSGNPPHSPGASQRIVVGRFADIPGLNIISASIYWKHAQAGPVVKSVGTFRLHVFSDCDDLQPVALARCQHT